MFNYLCILHLNVFGKKNTTVLFLFSYWPLLGGCFCGFVLLSLIRNKQGRALVNRMITRKDFPFYPIVFCFSLSVMLIYGMSIALLKDLKP